MSQSVYFNSPGEYRLAFLAARGSGDTGAEPVQVSVNGVYAGAAQTPADANFHPYSAIFSIPAAGYYTCALTATDLTGQQTTLLDDVKIDQYQNGTPYSGTPSAIPGTVQAENFNSGGEGVAYHDTDAVNTGGAYRTSEGVDIFSTSDTGGGYRVGNINSGEWLKYAVNVAKGAYAVNIRASSYWGGGPVVLLMDGKEIGRVNVPQTWGDDNFTTLTLPTSVQLCGGNYRTLTVQAPNGGFNLNWISFTLLPGAGPSGQPYGGTAAAIPGTVQAVNYNLGGEGVAYHDTDVANDGGAYRPNEGVDIYSTPDAGTGYRVGNINPGEWMNYAVNVAAGTYTVNIRASSYWGGGSVVLLMDGVVIGQVNVPQTWGDDNFTTLTLPSSVQLTAGSSRTLTVQAPNGGFNLNWISFTLLPGTGPNGAPYGGTPAAIPGTIQAVNYNLGGEGVAYHDTDVANDGGVYRPNEGVDIYPTPDAGTGYRVGNINSGEWMNYAVTVAAGTYTVSIRASSYWGGGPVVLLMDGVVIGQVNVPQTWGDDNFVTLTLPSSVQLTAGSSRTLTVQAPNGGFNLNWISFK